MKRYLVNVFDKNHKVYASKMVVRANDRKEAEQICKSLCDSDEYYCIEREFSLLPKSMQDQYNI